MAAIATFLADQVGAGPYRSASEVVRAGLRLLEERELHLSALRAALAVGEASGQPKPFNFDAFAASKTACGRTGSRRPRKRISRRSGISLTSARTPVRRRGYIRETQAAIERVAMDPDRRRARGKIREGFSSYAIRSHVVFYVPPDGRRRRHRHPASADGPSPAPVSSQGRYTTPEDPPGSAHLLALIGESRPLAGEIKMRLLPTIAAHGVEVPL